jgi:hypothetical protein
MLDNEHAITNHKSGFSASFGLLWRRQGVLWWIFAVNLICGALGTVPGLLRLRHALGHSLAAQLLTDRFDLGIFADLFRQPDVSLGRFTTTSYLFALVFFVFMLFVTGGVLETYRDDRRLTTGEFFAASGAYFWRFVRLLLLSIIPFVIVSMIYQTLHKTADRVGDRAIADQVGIFLDLGALVVFLLLALFVRLWFDIAQVRAVALNERRMWRNTWRAWRLTWGGFGRLYWMYFAIALFGWITFAIGLVIWAHLPATAIGAMFLLFELMMFAQVASRLWQLASATVWYQQHPEPVPAPAVVAFAPPTPEPFTSVTIPPGDSAAPPLPPAAPAALESEPSPRDPGPELPPADA